MENVEVNVRWRLPARGMVKINVHGSFYEQPLPNGNVSGIGVIVRDSRGQILTMLAGSLGIQDRRNNQFYALMEGCKRAFVENCEHFILETDHSHALSEWRNSTVEGVHPNHAYIVQQLNQRKNDSNFEMEVKLTDPNCNAMATYLAKHGAHNYKTMVVITQPFGRIFELWTLDMGLGSVAEQFMAVHQQDLVPEVIKEVTNEELNSPQDEGSG